MKQILLSIALILFATSCTGTDNVYKNAVLDYLQTENGIKTDFKIEFTKFELSDITVADSITILQEQYQVEKQKKIESAQRSVTHWENAIEKQQKKKNDIFAGVLTSTYQKDLEKAKEELQKANNWTADYIHRYDNRTGTDILAKKVDTYFSFQNPKLGQPVRQEMGAVFILSSDGTQCYKMIKEK
ncbi:hypothetical protein [Parabacteroides sp. PF5-9]|uniref:hypothetical protein n=1 Tax=Parabacteroides sp. PF5-9 TaxID=1742404 RepID=UPI002475B81B|nr:hypothetical protein [Parabacteroides sp. PF5-9]MDH6357138.1 hypothetical protein [Parabacteroides sp. PF5-9]